MATGGNPPLPTKHTSHRSTSLTPSPGPYDLPKPPGSANLPKPPAGGYSSGYHMPQPAGRSSSNEGSRASTPTGANQYDTIQPYPQPYKQPQPGQSYNQPYSQPQPGQSYNQPYPGDQRSVTPSQIQPAMQPYPGQPTISSGSQQQLYPMQPYGQSASPTAYGQPQAYGSNAPPVTPAPVASGTTAKGKDKGKRRNGRHPTWIVLSVITIFINPIFGGIATAFSVMSMSARKELNRKKYGQIAKFTSIVGIGLAVCLMIVAAIIVGTNNRGCWPPLKC